MGRANDAAALDAAVRRIPRHGSRWKPVRYFGARLRRRRIRRRPRAQEDRREGACVSSIRHPEARARVPHPERLTHNKAQEKRVILSLLRDSFPWLVANHPGERPWLGPKPPVNSIAAMGSAMQVTRPLWSG